MIIAKEKDGSYLKKKGYRLIGYDAPSGSDYGCKTYAKITKGKLHIIKQKLVRCENAKV